LYFLKKFYFKNVFKRGQQGEVGLKIMSNNLSFFYFILKKHPKTFM